MNDEFEKRWKQMVCEGAREEALEPAPFGFATRVLAQRTGRGSERVLIWQTLAGRALGILALLLVIAVAVEIYPRTSALALPIQDVIAQSFWML